MKKLAVAVLLLIAAPANAAEIDFKAEILKLDGSRIPTSAADNTPLTLGRALEEALIANNLPGDTADAAEKARRFWLALKVHEGKELTADEIALAKKVAGLAYGPLVIGRVIQLLDPAAAPK